ncbi:hypothetical protein B2J88_47195 [Rhodococcus sp. SRB_17]|uniref:hypothetical protein n=1 Tax=Rhodococcus sp. OK302 TaxID=1882769 RepID=UPI000B93AAD5|nr:hypothetical protein [Rhodococcus sp. OK302]NMM91788.1 hypothetical protein [Rhodococcus sp. SRB_17]
MVASTHAQSILDEKIDEYSTLMRVSHQSGQRNFTDDYLVMLGFGSRRKNMCVANAAIARELS